VVLEINRAVPLGLLVNELITNALRHAFPEGRGGTVSLRMEGRGGKLRITVSDNGVGIPREMLQGSEDPERTGINLAYLFAEQVGGILEIKSNAGTEVRLYCSVTEKEEP
jgi:two-component sensor histidine kinase